MCLSRDARNCGLDQTGRDEARQGPPQGPGGTAPRSDGPNPQARVGLEGWEIPAPYPQGSPPSARLFLALPISKLAVFQAQRQIVRSRSSTDLPTGLRCFLSRLCALPARCPVQWPRDQYAQSHFMIYGSMFP